MGKRKKRIRENYFYKFYVRRRYETVLDTGYYVITKSNDKKESIDIVYHFISIILAQKKLLNISRYEGHRYAFEIHQYT